jgi:hypothetical protein
MLVFETTIHKVTKVYFPIPESAVITGMERLVLSIFILSPFGQGARPCSESRTIPTFTDAAANQQLDSSDGTAQIINVGCVMS